jgi:hypothetical protein
MSTNEVYIIKPRGMPEADLPSEAQARELIITTDTGKIFIGQGSGHPLLEVGGSAADVAEMMGIAIAMAIALG